MTAAENVCYTLINVSSDSEPPSEVSLKTDLGKKTKKKNNLTFQCILPPLYPIIFKYFSCKHICYIYRGVVSHLPFIVINLNFSHRKRGDQGKD